MKNYSFKINGQNYDVQIDDAVVQEAFDRYMALREETGQSVDAYFREVYKC